MFIKKLYYTYNGARNYIAKGALITIKSTTHDHEPNFYSIFF